MLSIARRGAAFAALAAAAAIGAAGCAGGVKGNRADLANGKQLFVKNCGSCHTLARAETKGTVGPDLDAAFDEPLHAGFRRSVIRGLVKQQILYPNVYGKMPGKLVTGQDAVDVAAYVEYAAARPGQDAGPLQTKVAQKTTATEQGGKLEIDVDPNASTAYKVGSATATAGKVTISSKNPSATQHDIAIQQGTNGPTLQVGKTVANGGVSTVSVSLKPGKYTFYCTLPGHRAAGMVGTITVR